MRARLISVVIGALSSAGFVACAGGSGFDSLDLDEPPTVLDGGAGRPSTDASGAADRRADTTVIVDRDTGSAVDTGRVEDTGGGTPDTGIETPDTGAVDTGTPDTGTPDTGTPDTGTPDTGTPDAGVADSGAPTGPALLISDPGEGRIDLVTTSGAIVRTYPSPVSNLAGVAIDRRRRDGFFVVGRDSGSTIRKIAWSGASLPSLLTKYAHGTFRGLDYYLGATEAQDLLAFVHTNSGGIEVAGGASVQSGDDAFSMGFYNNTFLTGFWGVSLTLYTGTEIRGWYTHHTTDTIEDWRTASFQSSIPASVTEPRGIARAANGEIWVVDEATHRVVHLSSTGTVLDSFDTPGTKPAGLSYDPGP